MHPGGVRSDMHLFNFEKSANLKHPTGHSVRLIELNAFGAEFSSGSALYHWLRDDHILRGENVKAEGEEDASNSWPVLRKIYFRVLCDSGA